MKKLCILMVLAIALVSCLAVAETTVVVSDPANYIWCFNFKDDCAHRHMVAEFYKTDRWGNDTYKLICDCGGYAYVHAGCFEEIEMSEVPEDFIVEIKNSTDWYGSKPKVEYRRIEGTYYGHYVGEEQVDGHFHGLNYDNWEEGAVVDCTTNNGDSFTITCGEIGNGYCSLCQKEMYVERWD